MRVRSKGRTNLGLYEITTGSVSLFPACYLQGTPQLQRVEPSARGPPTFRLLRVALYFSLLFTGADERHPWQDALSAREAP
jgi:hypothetical protein